MPNQNTFAESGYLKVTGLISVAQQKLCFFPAACCSDLLSDAWTFIGCQKTSHR